MRIIEHPFKIHAWDAVGNRMEEELAAFSNQIVAARCFPRGHIYPNELVSSCY
jgi:hypothetical protein